MSNKIFVGGLSWNTNSEGLRAAFESFGEVVEAKVIMDRATGRSRGFGFVTFAQADDAKEAITRDGTELDGRTIRVAPAVENQDRGGDRRPPRSDDNRFRR